MPEPLNITITLNGAGRAVSVQPNVTIADLLRDGLGLTGAKVSCDMQVCGACTVLVDGLAVSGCTYLAVDADGKAVETVEGLATDGVLTPLQQAFIDHAAFQCGYCTPGMLMSGTALLRENPDPSREEVIAGMESNLCRCTGYLPIIDAVLQAAEAGAAGGGGARRGSVPQGSAPQGSAPQGSAPQGSAPQGSAGPGSRSHGAEAHR